MWWFQGNFSHFFSEGFWTGWVSFDNSPGTSNDEEQVDKIQRREFENYTMSYWSNGVPRWIECRDSVSNLSWVEQVNDTKGLQANPCSPKFGLVCEASREDDDYCLNYEQRFFFEKSKYFICFSLIYLAIFTMLITSILFDIDWYIWLLSQCPSQVFCYWLIYLATFTIPITSVLFVIDWYIFILSQCLSLVFHVLLTDISCYFHNAYHEYFISSWLIYLAIFTMPITNVSFVIDWYIFILSQCLSRMSCQSWPYNHSPIL